MERQEQSHHRLNMKLLLSVLLLVAPALSADDAPRFAYLVVPTFNTSTPAPTTVRPQQDEKQNAQSYNEEVMERLRQEAGPVYHIYLPDGRLQRVQYTAASAGEQTEGQRYGKQEAALGGFYYVQVPQERFQALRAPKTTAAPGEDESGEDNSSNKNNTNNQTRTFNQTNTNNQSSQAPVPARYTENAAANVNAEFVPVKFVTSEQLSQIRSSAAESSGRSPDEAFSRQAESPSQYLANVKYSEVQPIQGPVFSYSSDQLVRILRQA